MNLRYRATALEDLDAIYAWRSRQSAEVAARIEAAIFATIDWLAAHPTLGTRTDEKDVRRWSMTDLGYAPFFTASIRRLICSMSCVLWTAAAFAIGSVSRANGRNALTENAYDVGASGRPLQAYSEKTDRRRGDLLELRRSAAAGEADL